MSTTRVNTPYKYIFGRPCEYDLEAEAKALLAWSKKPDSLELEDFAEERDYLREYLSLWAKQDSNFEYAYKKANERIARRRTKLTNENLYNYGIYSRYQGMYDRHLQLHERDEKSYEASLRNKVESNQTEINAQAIAKAVKQMNDDK